MTVRFHDSLTPLLVPIDQVRPHPDNARQGDVEAVLASMRANGVYRPVVAQRSTGYVLAGNHAYAALMEAGSEQAAVVWVDVDDQHARKIILADNRTQELGGYDDALLADLIASVDDLTGTGYTDEDLAAIIGSDSGGGDPGGPAPTLADRFLIPPFTVLDARSGWWRERKRAWVATGIQSELGRLDDPTADGPQRQRTLGQGLQARRQADGSLGYEDMEGTAAVSIFDPVLCEVAYRWFCPPGGRVIDPYAGGSVRGLVAARLGLHYTGVDLRAEQVEANRTQAAALHDDPAVSGTASWHIGDASDVLPALSGPYDLAFTCPPYFDLEQYSADPADLSAMTTADFAAAYTRHLDALYTLLADDAWLVYVVGSARQPDGHLRDLRALTYIAATEVGYRLASDAVLITPAGSAPVRAGRQFTASRLLARTHQDVLIFHKGSRKQATLRLGQVDTSDALAMVDHTDDQEG